MQLELEGSETPSYVMLTKLSYKKLILFTQKSMTKFFYFLFIRLKAQMNMDCKSTLKYIYWQTTPDSAIDGWQMELCCPQGLLPLELRMGHNFMHTVMPFH